VESPAIAPELTERRGRRLEAAGLLGFAAIFALALDWAKWTPYLHKLEGIRETHVWPGHDILAKAGSAEAAPSLHGAWSFTTAYANSVWMALVAALLVSAAIEALIPRRWLLRVVSRRTHTSASLAGGLLALPSLMCTCCTAPVAATLRRNGAPTSAVLAYWLGNPVLNPAVLAFLALVAPWQWVVTRIVAGVVLVVGMSALIARYVDAPAPRSAESPAPPCPPYSLARAPLRFVRALARLSVTLLPEYVAAVFLVGLFRGWLFPLNGGAAHWGFAAVVVAAILGTLVVLPTGGEIPIVQALALAGVAAGVQGALLISLPAISLVSMAMVVRVLSLRVTLAAAASVAVVALGAGALLAVLT
jgi:uncharacterized membrane protein YraQ (UPF0718 family)